MVTLGLALMGVCFLLFALIPSLPSPMSIVIYTLLLRLFQGSTSAIIQTTCYSVAANEYPEKAEAIVGWVEAMVGLGLIFGPIIGSILYAAFDFNGVFYIYGALLILISAVVFKFFPVFK